MKSYLIKDLTSVDRERLTAAGVVLFDFDTSSDSVLFEEQYLEVMLETLNCTAKEKETDYEGIVYLKLKERKAVVEKPKPDPSDEQLKKRVQSRERYIKACAGRMEELLSKAREALAERARLVPSAQNKFFAAARASYLVDLPQDVAARRAVLEERLADEFRRVGDVPRVITAKMSGNNLCVYTETLKARLPESSPHGDAEIEVGAFLIIINLDGRHGGIRWFNSTRKVDGLRPSMNAPYVFSDGEPVVAEIRETMVELLARMELTVVVELAIQFVETVFDDEFGKGAASWPLVKLPPPPPSPFTPTQGFAGTITDMFGDGVNRFVKPQRSGRRK